jgi:O-antigen/teichoic acid export membrane protein
MSVVIAFALNTIFNFAVGILVAKFLGPAEYGRFALAMMIAMFVNSALFDWLKQAATRFYSQRAREERPQVRATLDLAFALITLLVGVVAIALTLTGVEIQLSGAMLALALAAGATNALFDFHAAIVRARFDDRVYARMIGVKHLLGMALTVGGAWWFEDARIALAGVSLSIAGSVLTARKQLVDDKAAPALAQPALARAFLFYGAPLVVANILALASPLITRSVVASHYGFAAMGQFALPFEIGVKLVAAVGSTLDVLLFQLAVRADETHGREQAKQQIARNMAIVLAASAATCVGFWLILPSFEALLVPQSYRGEFARYLTVFLPGFFAFSVMQFGLIPIFQIAKRTLPAIAAACVALATTLVMVFLAPADATPIWYAYAQSAGMCAAVPTLLLFALAERPVWPRWREVAAIAAGVATMTACVLPLRAMTPGVTTLVAQVLAGALACAPFLYVFNVGDIRRTLLGRLRPGASLTTR